MKFSTVKSILRIGFMSSALALAISYGASQPAAAQGEDIVNAASGQRSAFQQGQLQRLVTRLNQDTQLANVRSGPGLAFEVIGTVDDEIRIIATGRAEGSAWLQLRYQGQVGWLAGDLVEDRALVSQLPVVDTSHLEPAVPDTVQAQRAAPGVYFGIGARFEPNAPMGPTIASLMEGGPAQRAGIEIGDMIVAVDGQLTVNQSFDQVAAWVRREKDIPVILTIFRSQTNEQLQISIVREAINASTIVWSCQVEPIRGFGKVWDERLEVRPLLGCPFTNFRQDEHATPAAVQTFERGWMLWLETDTVANVDPIYVFFEDDGSYIRYGDRPLADAHAYAPTPYGFYKVGDRFARIYWREMGAQARARLGNAINEASDSLGAFQEFEKGRMFWAGEADTIYVIYQGYYNLDGDGQTVYQQGWTSFEDTFGDAAGE